MAELKKKQGKIFLELTEKEQKELDIKGNLELNKIKKGLFVLTETETFSEKNSSKTKTDLFDEETQELDEKIFELLSLKGKENLSKKVEGEFEKQLTEKEKQRFEELLKQGLIEKFKLNESYKKAIYRIKLKKGLTDKKEFNVNSPAKTIESNGFEVMVNENQAKSFCHEFSAEIKENKIKGIKGFDGYFYAIHSNLFEKTKPEVLTKIRETKNISLNDLTEKISLPKELIKGTIEFLKEEGDLIEKRNGLYQLIE